MQMSYKCVGRCVTILTGKLKKASSVTNTAEIPRDLLEIAAFSWTYVTFF